MTADVVREPGASRIRLGESADFSLGGLQISPARREVTFGDESRTLEPRVMQVLVALASARPAVVSRDELAETCWGGLNVGDDAINRCIVALRHLAKDFEPQPFAIETVPRVGYALVEAPGAKDKRTPRWLTIRFAMIALGAILLAGIAAVGWLRMVQSDPTPATIAVLPFRNLSSGDSYFAEGVSDEILGQLAREPEFRVAGRTTSAEFANAKDLRQAGRSLGVDHVLEGSVRKQGNLVRVSAALVRVRDGIQLWSGSYDGQLNDIFEIERRVGEAVAGAVRRRLVRTRALAGTRVRNGKAYNHYLAARSLIKTRHPEVSGTALELLREAVKLDPGYAPAWSSLAQAMRFDAGSHEEAIGILPDARRYAQHALKLAPDLAEAHAVLGMLLEFASPDAQAHLRRSSELDPNNSEYLIWLGLAQGMSGEFEQELQSYRRAHSLDPLWFRPIRDVTLSLAEFGERSEAEAFVRRATNRPERQHMLLSRTAATAGDYSEAVRRSMMVERIEPAGLTNPSTLHLITIRYALGLPTEPPPRGWVRPSDQTRPIRRVWMEFPPSPEEWKKRNRSRLASEVYHYENEMAAKLMLNAGRARELVATYLSDAGLLGVHRNDRVRAHQLGDVPVVALALRRAGQPQEADRLLREADRVIRTVHKRGRVPIWFDAHVAGVWAVQGRPDEALSMLERAVRRGWTHAGTTDLPVLGDEPAFSMLRNNPRFRRIAAELKAHLQREKQEIARLKV
jgi:TolB-like protein/DNA-binding winged helix-turn-helix (wHTH) protein/Tfp pilus assembly protein PilF